MLTIDYHVMRSTIRCHGHRAYLHRLTGEIAIIPNEEELQFGGSYGGSTREFKKATAKRRAAIKAHPDQWIEIPRCSREEMGQTTERDSSKRFWLSTASKQN